MLPSATALSAQQLAEFLAVVSAAPDGRSATRVAAERAARALEAEVAVLLGDGGGDGAVISSVGFPIGRVPVAQLAEVVAGGRCLIDVPGAGLCHTAVAPLAGRLPGHLLIARSGDDGFTVDEVSLLRGMARVLDLTVENLHRMEAERAQAAENRRLLTPIGLWVLREACRQAGAWNGLRDGQRPLTVSVNLSARQVQQPDLPGVVAQTLLETGLDPGCLVLEITESLLLLDTEATMQRLQQLKALGVRLAIDDFGTGYSSLAYLRRFPIDIIKIDKSFVDEIAAGPEASVLARAIVQLGQTLRLGTVAEGIEAADQLAELRGAGCQLGQGYYFAKPLERDEIEPLLTGEPALALLP